MTRVSTFLICCFAVLSLMLGTTTAQTFLSSYPSDHPFCERPGFIRVDRSTLYRSGVTVPTSICVLKYFGVCATVSGAQPCNLATGTCRAVEYDWENININSLSASIMARRPEVCAGAGSYFHPEVAVFAIAQPVLAFIIGFACIVIVILGVRHAGFLPGLWSLFSLMIVSCSFLLFGVWYLNAYLALLVTIAGVGMFASRHKPAILVGLLCIFVGLLWFTYTPGLGQYQHEHRTSSTSVERYETVCNSFYKGYFADPVEFKSSFSSPLIPARRYCQREYIAVEFFFLFLIELLFLMLFAYGGYMITRSNHDETA